jgi:hypothetical protein
MPTWTAPPASWRRGAPQQLAVERAQADGEEPFVARRAIEQGLQARALVVLERLGDRVGKRARDHGAAGIQVACEPAQRQLVHERHRDVGRRDQRDHERDQETQLKVQYLDQGVRVRGLRPSRPEGSGAPGRHRMAFDWHDAA